MANLIVKAKKTYLKSPLSTSDTSVILRELFTSKDATPAMADFGDWGVVVVKQGDNIEMIKFDGLTANADGSVTLDVATNGRHLNPTSPYAGSGTGLAFQSGAEVIVTNDPLTVSQFANLNNANTWALLQTFTVIPALPASNPTTDNQAVRKKYVDDTFVGLAGDQTVAGVKTFSSFPITPSSAPTTDYQVANKKYVVDNAVFLTGAQTVAGVKTFSSFPVTPSSAPTTDYQVANKKYVDDTAFAGVTNADSTTKGIVEEATDAEVRAGTATGATGARLYIPATLGQFLNPVGALVMYIGSTAPSGYLLCDGSAVSRATYADLYAIIGDAYGAGDGSTTFNLPDLRSSMPVGYGQKTKAFTFVDGDVNTGTDVITVVSNDFLHTGQAVVLSTSGVLPTGLSAGTYYVIRVTATTIKLASSRANAVAGTAVDITGASGGGTHTLTLTLTSRALGAEGGEENHALVVDEIPAHTHSLSNLLSTGGSNPLSQSANTSQFHTATGSTGGSNQHNNVPPYVGVNFIIKF